MSIDTPREFLKAVPAGPVTDSELSGELIAHLTACWDSLDGSNAENMQASKLDRAEQITWEPPRLSFCIERHGGTTMGSVYADLHSWTVDLNEEAAFCYPRAGRRQVRAKLPRLDVKPLAEEIVRSILRSNKSDGRLKWSTDLSRVTVLTGKVLPANSAVKQTLAGRRRRLAEAIRQRLEEQGWSQILHTSPHTFERTRST